MLQEGLQAEDGLKVAPSESEIKLLYGGFPKKPEFSEATGSRKRGTENDYWSWLLTLNTEIATNKYDIKFIGKKGENALSYLIHHMFTENVFKKDKTESIIQESKIIVDELLSGAEQLQSQIRQFHNDPQTATDENIGSLFEMATLFIRQIGEIERIFHVRYSSSWTQGGLVPVLAHHIRPFSENGTIHELLTNIKNVRSSMCEKQLLFLTAFLNILHERLSNCVAGLAYYQLRRGHFLKQEGTKSLEMIIKQMASALGQLASAKVQFSEVYFPVQKVIASL